MITETMLTRIDNDINGNPRYYIPVYHFNDYEMSNKHRLALGLEKYRGKKYGSGYVMQSYSVPHTVAFLNKGLAV